MDKGQQLRSKLTPNQITFCQGIADGLKPIEAYRKAFPGCKKGHAQAAARLNKKVNICLYIEHLRGLTEKKGTLSRVEKREILANIARNLDKSATKGEVVQALKVDNQMTVAVCNPKSIYLSLHEHLATGLIPLH